MNRKGVVLFGSITGVLLLLLAAAALFAGPAILGFLGLTRQTGTAELLPAEKTIMYAQLSINIQQQRGYENLKQAYLERPAVKEFLEEVEFLQEETEDGEKLFDFERDVLSWAGSEAAVAMLEGASEEPDWVVLVSVRDRAGAEKVLADWLARIEKQEGGKLEKREHEQGSYYQLTGGQQDPPLFAGLADGFLVMTGQEALLQEVRQRATTGNQEDSLASSAGFQQVLGSLPPEAALTVMVRPSFAMERYESLMSTMSSSPLREQQQAIEMVALSLTLQEDGLQIDHSSKYDPDKLSPAMREFLNQPANDSALLERVPASAVAVMSMTGMSQAWQQMESDPSFSTTSEMLKEEYSVDLGQDLFGWMTGEFAFAYGFENQEHNAMLLVETPDRAAAETGIDHLLGSLNELPGGPPLDSYSSNGQELQTIQNDGAGPLVTFGLLNEDLFVFNLGESYTEASTSRPASSLVDDERFKQVRARLPEQMLGYLYLNLDGAREALDASMGDVPEYQEMRVWLEPLHAFGAAARPGLDENNIQVGRLVLLYGN